jgi:hypothetical protein
MQCYANQPTNARIAQCVRIVSKEREACSSSFERRFYPEEQWESDHANFSILFSVALKVSVNPTLTLLSCRERDNANYTKYDI